MPGKLWGAYLRKLGHHAVKLDVDQSIVENLTSEKIDLAYIALHGKDGEAGMSFIDLVERIIDMSLK